MSNEKKTPGQGGRGSKKSTKDCKWNSTPLKCFVNNQFKESFVPLKGKQPIMAAWQKNPLSFEEASQYPGATGTGIVLGAANLVDIDIDRLDSARKYFAQYHVDIDAELAMKDNFVINSPNERSAKLLYRIPESAEGLTSATVHNSAGRHAVDFRCGPRQCVLPGSAYPGGGTYTGGNPGGIPLLPDYMVHAWVGAEPVLSLVKDSEYADYANALLDSIEEPVTPKRIADLTSALDHLAPTHANNYDGWMQVGMAMRKFPDPEMGMALFKHFSQKSSYVWDEKTKSDDGKLQPSPQVCAQQMWKDRDKGGNHWTNVFRLAAKQGWQNPGRSDDTDEDDDDGDEAPDNDTPFKPVFPASWLNQKGVFGDMVNAIRDGYNVDPGMMAVPAGLVALSMVSDNKFTVNGTPLSLYTIVCAPTGSGKGAGPQWIDAIGKRLGVSNRIVSALASEPALRRILAETSSVTYLSDELGKLIARAASGKSGYEKGVVDALTEMYGKGNQGVAAKRYADDKHDIDYIDHPFLNVYGNATPGEIYRGLSSVDLENGLINRILLFDAPAGGRYNLRRHANLVLPDNVIKALRTIDQFIPAGMARPDDEIDLCAAPAVHHPIDVDKDADDALFDFRVACHERAMDGSEHAAVWTRAGQNATSVAGLLSLARWSGTDAAEPRLTLPDATSACELVQYSCEAWLYCMGEMVGADPAFYQLRKKVMGYIINVKDYTDDSRFARYTKQGWMPKGKLAKLTRVKTKDLDEVLSSLTLSKEVRMISAQQGDGPERYIAR